MYAVLYAYTPEVNPPFFLLVLNPLLSYSHRKYSATVTTQTLLKQSPKQLPIFLAQKEIWSNFMKKSFGKKNRYSRPKTVAQATP